jgi:hypothetical protein
MTGISTEVTTGLSGYTIHLDVDGNEVFPCRCGETHTGDYAVYDHGHHNCFHDAALVDIGKPEVEGYLMCPQCGKTFWTEEGERALAQQNQVLPQNYDKEVKAK